MEKLKETSPKPQKHRLKCIVFCWNGPWWSLLFENGDPKHCGHCDSMEPKPSKMELRYPSLEIRADQRGKKVITSWLRQPNLVKFCMEIPQRNMKTFKKERWRGYRVFLSSECFFLENIQICTAISKLGEIDETLQTCNNPWLTSKDINQKLVTLVSLSKHRQSGICLPPKISINQARLIELIEPIF